jgi:hypothetical protein
MTENIYTLTAGEIAEIRAMAWAEGYAARMAYDREYSIFVDMGYHEPHRPEFPKNPYA